MIKILANDGIAESGKKLLQDAGYQVITDKVAQEDLIDFINRENIEILLVRSATKVRKDIFDGCEKLKMVGRGGVGMDNIDVEYGRSKGVDVFNTPASSSQSVAELVMGHLFASCRFLNDSYRNMASGDFKALKKKYGKGIELRGKTLLIVGFGRIGQSLASYALCCGMKIIADDAFSFTANVKVDVNGTELSFPISTTTDLKNMLPKADFISLHVPKQADGSAVITKAELELMKPSAFIVNASRGGVIDENDLIEALDNNVIAGAALDVYENEPTPNPKLLNHPKIATSPHIGAATQEAQDRIGEEIATKIITTYGKQ